MVDKFLNIQFLMDGVMAIGDRDVAGVPGVERAVHP